MDSSRPVCFPPGALHTGVGVGSWLLFTVLFWRPSLQLEVQVARNSLHVDKVLRNLPIRLFFPGPPLFPIFEGTFYQARASEFESLFVGKGNGTSLILQGCCWILGVLVSPLMV